MISQIWLNLLMDDEEKKIFAAKFITMAKNIFFLKKKYWGANIGVMGNCVLSFFPFLFLVEDIFNRATETSQSITFLDILIKSPQKTKPITKYPLITFYLCFFLGSNFCYKNTFCIERKHMDFSSFFLPKKNIS